MPTIRKLPRDLAEAQSEHQRLEARLLNADAVNAGLQMQLNDAHDLLAQFRLVQGAEGAREPRHVAGTKQFLECETFLSNALALFAAVPDNGRRANEAERIRSATAALEEYRRSPTIEDVKARTLADVAIDTKVAAALADPKALESHRQNAWITASLRKLVEWECEDAAGEPKLDYPPEWPAGFTAPDFVREEIVWHADQDAREAAREAEAKRKEEEEEAALDPTNTLMGKAVARP